MVLMKSDNVGLPNK